MKQYSLESELLLELIRMHILLSYFFAKGSSVIELSKYSLQVKNINMNNEQEQSNNIYRNNLSLCTFANTLSQGKDN